jgi:hypothetical protein
MIAALLRIVRGFGRAEGGSVAAVVALAVPALFVATAVAVETTNTMSARSKVQAAADTAALSAAREIRFANARTGIIEEISATYARAQLRSSFGDDGGSITSRVDLKAGTVEVAITREHRAQFADMLGTTPASISARATARIGGGTPVCVLGLDRTAKGAIELDERARLTADRCAVYANSSHEWGLDADSNSRITAQVICTAGGKFGRRAAFVPEPLTKCPQISDPMAGRPLPRVGACTHRNLVISGRDRRIELPEGVYCGGLTITGRAQVTLRPGVHVIKDGPLIVDDGASLTGQYVGIFLTGVGTRIVFRSDSVISLGAPKSGDMAGLLFFEDPASPILNEHRISSNDARTLLGTIYLPNGKLEVDSERPVADQSAYTIIVVRRLELSAGPNLIMNADYAKSDVPVPEGVGRVGQTVSLVQ